MTRASSAIFSKGYGFLFILSSLDLTSSRKGQLETCVQSSVAQRQFHIEWDYMRRFCKALPWALRHQCTWVIRILVCSDIRTFGAAGTVLNFSSQALLLDSSGLLTMFLGSGWLNFRCQFRGVWPWRPPVVSAWFRLGSAWFRLLALRCSLQLP